MRFRLVIVLIAVLGLIVVLGFVFDERRVSDSQLDRAIERGLTAIARLHTPYRFADPYLEYVYPGEALECGLPDCRITYRTLDAYFALTMLGTRLDSNESGMVESALAEGAGIFADLVPRWRNAPIVNTLTSKPSDANGIALDTYCILGTLERDQGLAQRTLGYLDAESNWIADDFYQDDRWRNIADETWCLRLLAAADERPAPYEAMLEKAIAETNAFLASGESASAKLGVLYHTLFLLRDAAPGHPALGGFASRTIDLVKEKGIAEDSVALGNALESLSVSGYADSTRLSGIAHRLLALQGDDGAWRSNGMYPVFTTLRALNGLAAYREVKQ